MYFAYNYAIQEHWGISCYLTDMPVASPITILWSYLDGTHPTTAMCIFCKETDQVLLILPVHTFSHSFEGHNNIWNLCFEMVEHIPVS